MPTSTRTQLTLFVPAPHAGPIEAVRRVLDPVQASLIAAHVTLCREDELAALPAEALRERLAGAGPLTLAFGAPVAFDGHGILLPCVRGEREFRALRVHVLGRDDVRDQRPHLTLAHPRNPRAPGNSLAHASALRQLEAIPFATACRIRQDGAAPWRVLESFALA